MLNKIVLSTLILSGSILAQEPDMKIVKVPLQKDLYKVEMNKKHFSNDKVDGYELIVRNNSEDNLIIDLKNGIKYVEDENSNVKSSLIVYKDKNIKKNGLIVVNKGEKEVIEIIPVQKQIDKMKVIYLEKIKPMKTETFKLTVKIKNKKYIEYFDTNF